MCLPRIRAKEGREGKGKTWRFKQSYTEKIPDAPYFQRQAAISIITTCVFFFFSVCEIHTFSLLPFNQQPKHLWLHLSAYQSIVFQNCVRTRVFPSKETLLTHSTAPNCILLGLWHCLPAEVLAELMAMLFIYTYSQSQGIQKLALTVTYTSILQHCNRSLKVTTTIFTEAMGN